MILIVVRNPIRPEIADQFPQLVEDFTTATRAEAGCISFEWSRSAEDPNVYFLVEVFKDHDASEAHVATDHFKAAMVRLPQLLGGAPRIIHANIPGDGWSRMAELEGKVTEG